MLLLLALAACTPARAPTVAGRMPDLAWVRSEKLDVDVQELVVRAYDYGIVFPFRVQLSAPLGESDIEELVGRGIVIDGEGTEVVALALPTQLDLLLENGKVTKASCAAPEAELPADDGWRERVTQDVRIVYAANSSCYFPVRITFYQDVADERAREALEAVGARVLTLEPRESVAFVPVRAIPQVANLTFVSEIALAERPPEP